MSDDVDDTEFSKYELECQAALDKLLADVIEDVLRDAALAALTERS